MKAKKVKTAAQPKEIDSLKQFKEMYFPGLLEREKEENEDKKNYGNAVAMSILTGISRDLQSMGK